MRDTQIQAWASLQGSISGKRREVLTVIYENDCLALFEIAEILQIPFHHVSGRITELFEMGLIQDSGIRKTNPTSNKEQIAWTWTGSSVPREFVKETSKEKIERLTLRVSQLEQLLLGKT